MLNIEKYKNKISQLVNEVNSIECSIATVAGIPCFAQACKECQKKCLEWMYSEYKEEILSDDEKDIIKSIIKVIRKLECEVNYVYKSECRNGDCFIRISFRNIVTGRLELMDLPYLNNDMFKGMELGKNYTLEELGITCQTQKDSFGRR